MYFVFFGFSSPFQQIPMLSVTPNIFVSLVHDRPTDGFAT
jgi:hypothetical protein